MKIFNTTPFVKHIKTAHFFRADTLPYSLSEVLRESYTSFISSDNYLRIEVLPENVKPNCSQKKSNSGVYWTHRISMDINYQSSELRALLNLYDNATVVCGLESWGGQVYLYGNSDQPLQMSYSDVDPANAMENIGHQITLSGDTYGSPKMITTFDFYSPIELASWLATPL